MKFIQYIDPLVVVKLAARGIFAYEFEFCSLNDFLNHPRILFYTRDENFKRFVICRGDENEVISELKCGRAYKIGIVDGNMHEIPEWNPVKPVENTGKDKDSVSEMD